LVNPVLITKIISANRQILSSGCESKWKVIALEGDFFTVPISVVLDLQINTFIYYQWVSMECWWINKYNKNK